jgi:hypothetical protein
VSVSISFLFVVIDGSALVKSKVKERVDNSKLPTSLKDAVANRAGHVASKRIKPSKIAQNIGTKLCERTPQKMAEMGVTVAMEQVFREGPLVVLQLQVQHVDARAIEKVRRQEAADLTQSDTSSEATVASALLEWCLRIIGSDNQKKLESEFLPEKVQAKLESKILEIMTERFERKGLEVDVEIVREERQAKYFFRKLKEMREPGEGST